MGEGHRGTVSRGCQRSARWPVARFGADAAGVSMDSSGVQGLDFGLFQPVFFLFFFLIFSPSLDVLDLLLFLFPLYFRLVPIIPRMPVSALGRISRHLIEGPDSAPPQ